MWLIPSAFSACSPVSEGLNSPSVPGSPEWAEAIASSLSWNGKPRRSAFWLREWKTGDCLRALCGRATFDASPLPSSVASWISSLRASRAPHTAAPPAAEPSRTTSGLLPFTSSTRFAHGGSSWRTSSDPRSSTLPTTFTELATAERLPPCPPPKWVPRTNGDAGGYLPTLTATMNQLSPSMMKWPGHRRLRAYTGGEMPSIRWWTSHMGFPMGWLATSSGDLSSPPRARRRSSNSGAISTEGADR